MSLNISALLIFSLIAILAINLAREVQAEDNANAETDYDDYETYDDDIDLAELEVVPFTDADKVLPKTMDFRAFKPGDSGRTYGVIVDCGSSGTRAHLYEWDSSLTGLRLLNDIGPMRGPDKEPLSEKFSPGLSSFADAKKEEIEKYIARVLNFIERHIPRHLHPYTGVYILATAGMRMLDDEEQRRIIEVIRLYIEDNYNFAKIRTGVMTGAHEGMYQWISVNSKAKRFLANEADDRTDTYAVIEMGGASLQVTYRMQPACKEHVFDSLSSNKARMAFMEQIVEPELSRKGQLERYQLFSTTFLGFGSNSAREAYLDLLVHKHFNDLKRFVDWSTRALRRLLNLEVETENSDEPLVLADPCLPTGYIADKVKKPREMLKQKHKILGYLAEDYTDNFSIELHGTGNYRKCKRLVEEMLNLAKKERLNCKESYEACTMSLIGEPIINFNKIQTLGVGDIYHTTNLMLEASGLYHHDEIVKKTKKICSTPYDELIVKFKKIYDNENLRSRIADECFKAIWVDTFLVKGLKMPTGHVAIETRGKIGNDELDWTMGAILDKSLGIEKATEFLQAQMETFLPKSDEQKVVVIEPIVGNEDGQSLLKKYRTNILEKP